MLDVNKKDPPIDFGGGMIGYTMRTPPPNRVSTEAVALVQQLPSVGELFLTNGSSFGQSLTEEVPVEPTGTLELDDAIYEFGITDAGSVQITKCSSAATSLTVPAVLQDAPVRVIGSHAFSTCYKLEQVELPEGLEQIYGYSFMNTALQTIAMPTTLRTIGTKAFYKCTRLRTVELNEGLLSIDEAAFRESGVESIEIPASVVSLGQGIFDGTGIACDGEGPHLSVASGNPHFFLQDGALYSRTEDGAVLVQLIDEAATVYVGLERLGEESAFDDVSRALPLVHIAPRAFADKKNLRTVELPEGVRSVGEAAFRGCTKLTAVHLPETLESLGFRAFWETALKELRIPPALREVGTAALHTGGTVSSAHTPTLHHVDIAEGNDVFYLHKGLLCARRSDGRSMAVLYTGQGNPEGDAEIPHEVVAIGPYAFSNTKGLRSLRFHSDVTTIDISGFDFGAIVPKIIYDDLATGESYILRFPSGHHGYTAMRQSFNRGSFNLEAAYEQLDRSASVTRDVLTRSQTMLDRILHPAYASPGIIKRFREQLQRSLPKVVVEFGRNGFPQGIDMLLEAEVLTQDNIEEAIDAAVGAGEVAVLSRLIELRRTAFGAALFDFDL